VVKAAGIVSENCEEQHDGIPAPKERGLRKIMLNFEAPARWYTARTHARKTISSVIGAYRG
jgi:hypothetical protein